MRKKENNKIVVILGPTAVGKTKLAVKLAYKFNGEIISADSRQVYKGMDIGTGKDLEEYILKIQGREVIVKHHLIDIVLPNIHFNLAKYQKMAYKSFKDIWARNKLPFLVGGSGLYLQAVVDGYILNNQAKIDKELRKKLEKMSFNRLLEEIKKQSKNCKMTNQELKNALQKNKRRAIRYIEMIIQTKKSFSKLFQKKQPNFSALIIGLKMPRKELDIKIEKRINKWLRQGLIKEVENLHRQGISWKRLEEFGLEYKYVSLYLRGKIQYNEMIGKIKIAIRQFVKRQMTWFKRWQKQGRKIYWINIDSKSFIKVAKKIKMFI